MKRAIFFLLIPLFLFSENFHTQDPENCVVFIANTRNAFDAKFQCSPDSYYEYLRPFYEYFWPPEFGHGSGFLISQDGYLVTNAHVVEGTTSSMIAIENPHLEVYKAKVIGIDRRADIAVLKIESSNENFPYLSFGNSDAIRLGDPCYLIGSPHHENLRNTYTVGIISGKNRNIRRKGSIENLIQTDAASNPGNSGGPLLNSDGEVIGVLKSGFNRLEGLSFAIPSNTAQKIADQIILHGKTQEGFHGIEVKDDYKHAYEVYYFDETIGAQIVALKRNSPAEKAGVQVDDVILEVNGKYIPNSISFWNEIRLYRPDETIHLRIKRGEEILAFKFKLSFGIIL